MTPTRNDAHYCNKRRLFLYNHIVTSVRPSYAGLRGGTKKTQPLAWIQLRPAQLVIIIIIIFLYSLLRHIRQHTSTQRQYITLCVSEIVN